MQPGRDAFFETMVKDYGPKLYNLIRSIVLNHDDASDLLQETLIKAWKALGTFRNEASYTTWLYRIALNEALRHQRHAALKNKFFRSKPPLKTEPTAVPNAEAVLSAALHMLTPRQRGIFAMHYFNNLSFTEIASMLQIAESTAKATYHQSANKIKQYIHQHAEY
jgi:RNA polymerase sigma-70 factor (ECF subfamily)